MPHAVLLTLGSGIAEAEDITEAVSAISGAAVPLELGVAVGASTVERGVAIVLLGRGVGVGVGVGVGSGVTKTGSYGICSIWTALINSSSDIA